MPKCPSKSGLSQSAFAHVMGVDRAQVTRWKARGLPMLTDDEVHAEAASDWVRSSVDTYKIRGSVGAKQMAVAERRRYEEQVAHSMLFAVEFAAEHSAKLAMGALPEAAARKLATDLHAMMHAEATAYLDEEFRPPQGCVSWRTDTNYMQPPFPDDEMWDQWKEDLKVKAGAAAP